MPYPWLCLWDRTLEAEKAQLLPPPLFKAWINLLCLANRQEPRGILPAIKSIAYALRVDTKKAAMMMEQMVEAQLIDRIGDVLQMHDWDEWQYQGRSSAERSKEWRETQRDRALDKRSTERSEDEEPNVLRARVIELKNTETVNKTPRAPRKRGSLVVDFILPDWIPEQDWNDWLEMRRKKRAHATKGAMVEAVRILDGLRGQGFSPGDVLRQSTLRSWTGVFPIQPWYARPSGNGNGNYDTPVSKPQLTPEQIEAADARWK